MAFYEDPTTQHHRPSLIEDLFRLPAKAELHPLENQATATLAWLIDRAPEFARAFVDLFLGSELAPAGRLGARTWVTLPRPGGGVLFPDLCVEAADRQLQLLVEVKVASILAQHQCIDGRVRLQDEMYRWSWSALPGPHATVRAVGTLTRPGGRTPTDPDRFQAADVTWSQLRDLIEQKLGETAFGPETELVAASFVRAIKARIAVDTPTPERLEDWLASHTTYVVAVATALHERIPGSKLSKAGGAAFVGRRVHVPDVLGSELRLRVYASPAGAALNLVGEPDAIIVGIERDAGGTLEPEAADIFGAAGFPKQKDIAGAGMHRRVWPFEQPRAEPAAVASAIWDQLAETGIPPWARGARRLG